MAADLKKYHSITSELRVVDPKRAEMILEDHENYRRLSRSRYSAYAAAMARGRWGLSVLIFDEDGRLLDGQNRLQAIVNTGLSQVFLCVQGWPKTEVRFLDNGQARTRGQVAVYELGIDSANIRMALAVGIETISDTKWGAVLNDEAILIYEKYKDTVIRIVRHLVKPLRAAVHGIAFCRAMIACPDRADDIENALVCMNNLDFSEGRMQGLRLYYQWAVTRGFTQGGTTARQETYRRCARAIQAYLENQMITKLYVPKDDPFPLPAWAS